MKNKKLRALSCLLAGCIILTGAVFANIDNANGYTSYKNAIKNFMKLENYTADIDTTVYIDDIEIGVFGIEAKVENKNAVSITTSECAIDDEDNFTLGLSDVNSRVSKSYIDGNFDIYVNNSRYDNGTVTIRMTDDEDADENEIYNPIMGESIDGEIMDKAITFAEAAADGFIGDIKNNFVYLGEENGEKHYNVTLSKEQMPNIVTSGLSLACGIIQQENGYSINGSSAVSRVYNYNSANDIVEMMFTNEKEPFIKTVSCDFKTTKSGNLTYNTLNGVIAGYTEDGNEHTISVKVQAEIRDIGTTTADKYDVYNTVGETKMLDGSVKTFKELIESYNRVTIVDGKRDIYAYNITNNGARNASIYILNGREVSNTEYNEKSAELAEETRSVDVTINENSADGAASVGVIGGADGPTAVYVTD